MTDQELFDKIASHLLTQSAKALRASIWTNEAKCAYRGEDGTSCAIGCLIPDEEYDESFEGKTLLQDGRIMRVAGIKSGQSSLALRLQNIHDRCDVSLWKDYLLEAAREFKLSTEVVR